MDTTKRIWAYLMEHGMTRAGAAGMMGNMKAESGLIPNRVEILCLQRLRENGKSYTDATYTAFVDDGTITRAQFLNPLPGKQYGYGLCQWTSPARKAGLYDLCKQKNVSIGDLEAQLEWLITELRTTYQAVWSVLTSTDDIAAASDIVLIRFEVPGDVSQAMKQTRYSYSKEIYDQCSGKAAEAAKLSMTEAQAIDRVLSIALAEEGYHEKASDSSLYDKTANSGSGNYQKFGKEMHALQPSNMDYPAAWCDAFVDWCMYRAFGDLARKVLCGTYDDYTINSAAMYRMAGRWTATPGRGHQIFFRRNGEICHTGLVYDVSNGKVYTIEGNAGDVVTRKVYDKTDPYIAGYGMPNYSLAASAMSPGTSDPGEAAIPEKRATQAAEEFDRTVAGTYRTTAKLHVRDGAGKSFRSLGILPKGTKVQNYGYFSTASSGLRWLYIQVISGGVKYTGFSLSKYLKKI